MDADRDGLHSASAAREDVVAMTEDSEEWYEHSASGISGDIDLWDDLVEVAPESESGEVDIESDLEPHLFEIPRAPASAGVAHLVRLGLCDPCLGRLSGMIRFDEAYHEGGVRVRAEIMKRDPETASIEADPFSCPACEGMMNTIETLAQALSEELEGFEFGSLQIGAMLPLDLAEEDEGIRDQFGAPRSDRLKAAIVKSMGEIFLEQNPDVKLTADSPDAVTVLDLVLLRADIELRPLYIYGRYRKLIRNLPQTRWPCRRCKGREGGCEECEHTGLRYPDSVQDLIGKPVQNLIGGSDVVFHGMGREDIDVRCLGSGRPFVIEVREPVRRTVDFEAMEEIVNAAGKGSVEVLRCRHSTRKEVVRVKESDADKSYEIRFKITDEGPVIQDDALVIPEKKKGKGRRRGRYQKNVHAEHEKKKEVGGDENESEDEDSKEELPDLPDVRKTLDKLSGVNIEQRTPERVQHRRADRIRKRKVVNLDIKEIEKDEVVLVLRTQSGTYVKEFVHGDKGRTQPSVAASLGRACNVIELDVIEVHSD